MCSENYLIVVALLTVTIVVGLFSYICRDKLHWVPMIALRVTAILLTTLLIVVLICYSKHHVDQAQVRRPPATSQKKFPLWTAGKKRNVFSPNQNWIEFYILISLSSFRIVKENCVNDNIKYLVLKDSLKIWKNAVKTLLRISCQKKCILGQQKIPSPWNSSGSD